MKHRKKLRRVVILALVLVLLCNTLGVSASTEKQEPKVIVSSYGELYTAYADAESGDVIGVKGTIVIPTLVSLNTKYVTFRRMEAGAKLLFSDSYDTEAVSEVKNVYFDGNATEAGGTDIFVMVNGKVNFSYCEFKDSLYEGGNGGSLYIGSGEVNIDECKFEGSSAYYGSHLYNAGTVTITNSTFRDGWADEMGGAIFNAGTLYIINSEIKENNARTGGGIYNNASMEINNSLVWNNTGTRQGADIANEGTYTNNTTEEQFNSWLNYYKLYYAGWEDDTNTSIGGAGDYLKFLTTTEAPTPSQPTDPEEPEPTEEPTTEVPSTEGGDDVVPPTTEEPSTEETEEGSKEPSTETGTDPALDQEEDPKKEEPTTEIPDTGEQGKDEETPTSTPSDADEGGSGGGNTDNSQSSSNSTTDNSSSSSVSNVDNSSNRSDSSKVENSHNTSNNTTNNYTTNQPAPIIQPAPQESKIEERVIYVTDPASQSSNSTEVGSNATKATESPTEAPSELTAGQDQPVNLKLDIQGANVVYEQGEDGYNISISYSQPQTITASQVATGSIQPAEQENKPNWVEVVTMILLLVLVLGELKDKLKKQPE